MEHDTSSSGDLKLGVSHYEGSDHDKWEQEIRAVLRVQGLGHALKDNRPPFFLKSWRTQAATYWRTSIRNYAIVSRTKHEAT